MPQRVKCDGCGYILYEGLELKPIYEIIQQHGEKCPNCGRKLSEEPIIIKIYVHSQNRRRRWLLR
jgi:hypothetical protein